MKKKLYGAHPKIIGGVNVNPKEFMFYQDMLIKLSGGYGVQLEERLKVFEPIVKTAVSDFIQDFGKEEYEKRFVYISAKNLYQNGSSYNREGWHCDGFGSSDINYIWSNASPTQFNFSDFNLSDDDSLSMSEMTEQANPHNDKCYRDLILIRLDELVVHRANPNPYEGVRAFVKVSFSRDRFDLLGNTINPLIDYNWTMRLRSQSRNIPQHNQSK